MSLRFMFSIIAVRNNMLFLIYNVFKRAVPCERIRSARRLLLNCGVVRTVGLVERKHGNLSFDKIKLQLFGMVFPVRKSRNFVTINFNLKPAII